jgi:hypothetical protein
MVRNRAASRARELEQSGLALHEGDVLRPQSLRGAGRGVDVAYYLIHSMGRGGSGVFVASERAAATSFAQMARKEKIERVVYLGGLGDRPHSKHLRSRHETALALAEHGPPLTYFRAGMVVGAQSESYRTLRHLVQRLPAMIAPAWLKNATQPIAIDDTLRYLVQAPGDRRLDRQGDPDRRSGRSEPRRDARSHGDGAQSPPPPAGTRPFHHTVAVLAVDRRGHTGRRRRRPAAGRGARRADRRHRPVWGAAVRRADDDVRRGAPPRRRRGSRTPARASMLPRRRAVGRAQLARTLEAVRPGREDRRAQRPMRWRCSATRSTSSNHRKAHRPRTSGASPRTAPRRRTTRRTRMACLAQHGPQLAADDRPELGRCWCRRRRELARANSWPARRRATSGCGASVPTRSLLGTSAGLCLRGRCWARQLTWYHPSAPLRSDRCPDFGL